MDHHVLARLESHGHIPSPEADRAQWLRRASLDLIGLPPTPQELQNFLNDLSEESYEKQVNRLLASPAFGERWASLWMDLARYADTKGYEKDQHRHIWPFRDYLIQSLNQDKPYDQFVRELLAGDLMPDTTAEQQIASSFHRNTQTNTEGGTDDEEFRVAAVIDRVNTTWTAFQGLTFGCVQCHAHPYEPIPHEDYYRFMAYFNSTADHDQDNEHPVFKVANDHQQRDKAARLFHQIHSLKNTLNNPGRNALEKDNNWQNLHVLKATPQHGNTEIRPDQQIHTSAPSPSNHKSISKPKHKISPPSASTSSAMTPPPTLHPNEDPSSPTSF